MALKDCVKKGGPMSSCLFAIFIDDIVVKFKTLGRFCNYEYVRTNIFLYADDIVFLLPSLSDTRYVVLVRIRNIDVRHVYNCK